MMVYAITDTKKGRTGIAPTYLQTTQFWQHQDILYDYKAELTGVGNRSQINADDTIVL